MTTPQTKKPRELATPDKFDGLTIMRMTVQNVKAVRYIDITFDDTMTIVGGDNAQGKSSFLGSYDWLFGGREAIDHDPIRTGEAEGFIAADFGDGKSVQLSVKRTLMRVGENDFACGDVEIDMPGYITPSQRETFLEEARESDRGRSDGVRS
jgi:predicted ATPase